MTGGLAGAGRWLARGRGRLVIALVIVVGLYFVVAFGEQMWKARQLQAEVAERRAAVAELQAKHDQLQRQLDGYADDARYLAYVEQIARRDLNLSHPGETVLLVRWLPAPTPTATPSAAPAGKPGSEANWQRWLEVLEGR